MLEDLKQQNWVGDCFRAAFKAQECCANFTLVHALVKTGKGKTFPHAWIENENIVVDLTIEPMEFAIGGYYNGGDPDEPDDAITVVERYTRSEALELHYSVLDNRRMYGPWNNFLFSLMRPMPKG